MPIILQRQIEAEVAHTRQVIRGSRPPRKTHVPDDPGGGAPQRSKRGSGRRCACYSPVLAMRPNKSRGLRRLESPPRATTTLSAASSWPGGVSSMRYHLLPRRPAVKWVASMLGAQRECARDPILHDDAISASDRPI